MTPNSNDDPTGSVPEPLVDYPRTAAQRLFRSKVYRAKEANDWIVEAPRDMVSYIDKMIFTGPRAQQLALTYAYEKFGNARFFPY